MTGIFIIFMVIILILAILLVYSTGKHKWDGERNNEPFINEDGDHEYYDHGLIEKKEFRKRHPEVNDLRTFRRLFSRKPEDKI